MAEAQIDPEPRLNLEIGIDTPLRDGNGPVSGYAFLLWNRPHFLDDDLYLRIVFTPTYLTGELVRDRWPTQGQAVGLGGGGGLFPYNFDEFRGGVFEKRESFWGHGGDATVSYYPRLKIADVLPIEGQIRLRPQFVVYQRSPDTDKQFQLPADTPIYSARVGVRVGGVPPELLPEVALELSLWHELSYRQFADAYGFPERPQALTHLAQRSWGRLGGVATIAKMHTIRAFVTAGATGHSDALSSFRLGSAVPLRSEFPLVLHGYYVDEVFAHRFWLVNVSYRFPLWPGSERLQFQIAADYARVDYLTGHELPRRGLRGVGADLTIALAPRRALVLGYGYGPDAPRRGHSGGHEASVFFEVKF